MARRNSHIHLHHRHVPIDPDGVPSLNVDSDAPILGEGEVSLPVQLFKRQRDSGSDSGSGSSGSRGGSGSSSDDSGSSGRSGSSSGSSTSSSSSSSSNGDPEENNVSGPSASTIAISVSIVVPIVIALIVFYYLHRRNKQKLRLEEENDPHKSFDFGIDPSLNPGKKRKGKKGVPEMTSNDELAKSLHGRGGMSVDIGGSPYFMPPEMHQSKESLQSLSRSLGGVGDPYRPATVYERPDDVSSVRSHSTARTGRTAKQDGMKETLLRNAQRMSTSGPPPPVNELPNSETDPEKSPSPFQQPAPAIVRKDVAAAPMPVGPVELDAPRPEPTPSPGPEANAVRQSNNYLAGFIHSREASIDGSSTGQSPSVDQPHAMSPPPRGDSMKNSPTPPQNNVPIPQISIEAEFPGANLSGHNEIVIPPSPDAASRTPGGTGSSPGLAFHDDIDVTTPFYTPAPAEHLDNPTGLGVSDVEFDSSNRLSILRPLPPEDPTDTAEQRANRIRSFYKEYFNDSEARTYQANDDYYEDYGSEFLGDATVFDPVTGQFIVAQAPYATPVTRRAMTPPPRGPPRRGLGRPGRSSNGSHGGPVHPRGRAYSSASTSRMGPGGRPPPKRLPPPKALRTLPTPHLLKEDAFVLPIDFAPPSKFKDRAAGRPDSPFMESRPFSPAVPIANPLASAYNELPVMPSPHMLRKSGTFTALDFAPPPKFKNDGMSDAASMRSGRSGHSARSAAHTQNIRNGAFRVSRIPTELVATRKEFEQTLRPQWKLGN